jgi:hypothetical protein
VLVAYGLESYIYSIVLSARLLENIG